MIDPRLSALLLERIVARRVPGRMLVVGLCGAQGAGKSTLSAHLAAELAAQGRRVAVLSLDDLYLSRAERLQLAAAVHPLFATRGVPGTHDVALGLATLLPATARFDDGWRWTQRLLVHGVRALIGPALDALRLARAARRRSGARRGLRHGLRTLAVPLAGSALFLALFALANPLIAQALATLSITAPDERLVSRLMLWGVLGLITWGVLRPRPPRRLLPSSPTGAAATLPGFSPASVTVSLILFNLLFLAQNLLDALFLWGGAPLPGAMTLADYAHRGAYPLVATALLAALFVLVALRPGSPTAMHRPVRPLVLLWIAQNLVLVASAALRACTIRTTSSTSPAATSPIHSSAARRKRVRS